MSSLTILATFAAAANAAILPTLLPYGVFRQHQGLVDQLRAASAAVLPIPPLQAPAGAEQELRRYRELKRRAEAAYCQPGQPCWPTAAQWAAFNASLGGALLAVQPEGSPCYSDPSGAACAWIVGNWTSPYWRAAQVGAMQSPNFEAANADGANCFSPESGLPCSQGDVPPFAVAVTQAQQASTALVFAAAHNLRVVVKTSGHEFQGRSTAPDALLLWMHTFSAVAIHDAFSACPGDTPVPAVTAGSGDTYGDLYPLVTAKGLALVGGSARTVSAAGGHVLGGGHSFMSPSTGLAVDNVLSFTAVLSNGTLVTASRCSHPDLFWALRGGGGGSFAVLLTATHALHPVQQVTGLSLGLLLLRGLTSVDVALQGFLGYSPSLLSPGTAPGGGVWAGYWSVAPVSATQYVLQAALVFNGTVQAAQASAAPFSAWLQGMADDIYIYNATYTAFPSFDDWHNVIDNAESGDQTGVPLTLGSRLVPIEAVTNLTRLGEVAAAFTTVAAYVPLNGMMVAGGAVATADPEGLTSVTPAWRRAVQHVAFGLTWARNATQAEVDGAYVGASNLTSVLVSAMPDSGAYFSESDLLDSDWQDTFFGGRNYQRLQALKAAYDPAGRFACWHCVALP